MPSGRPRAIISLDVASSTGFAVAAPHVVAQWPLRLDMAPDKSIVEHIEFDTFSIRGEHEQRRFMRFANWLADLIEEFTIDGRRPRVVKEQSYAERRNVLKVLFGLEAIVYAECMRRDIIAETVAPSTIKKHVTGKGRGSKDPVMAWAVRCGFPIDNDDEADALALLDYAATHPER